MGFHCSDLFHFHEFCRFFRHAKANRIKGSSVYVPISLVQALGAVENEAQPLGGFSVLQAQANVVPPALFLVAKLDESRVLVPIRPSGLEKTIP